MSLEITLPPARENSVSEKVVRGDYQSPSEVVSAALPLLCARETNEFESPELEALLRDGMSQPATTLTAVDWDEIRRGGRERLRARVG